MTKYSKAFTPTDKEGQAQTKIKNLCQGSKDIKDHIAVFHIPAGKTGTKNDAALREYYMGSINLKLLEKIYLMPDLPQTLEKWIEVTAYLEAQWK